MAAAEKDLDDDLMITATVSFRGTTVAKQCVLANQKHVETTINVAYEGTVGLEWGVRVWTPAEPDLYELFCGYSQRGDRGYGWFLFQQCVRSVSMDQTFY